MTPEEYVSWYYEKFRDERAEIGRPAFAIERQHRDQAHIIKLIEEHKCESILEIGTWLGQTGLLIWLHPDVKKFKAIDINKDMNVIYENLTHPSTSVAVDLIGDYLKYSNTSIDFIDTMKWEPLKWKENAGHFDMIFIDANHEVDHVKNDTLKAIKLNPKIIVWHDVNHDEGKDHVPTYLREFKTTYPKFEVKIIPNTEIGYILLQEKKNE